MPDLDRHSAAGQPLGRGPRPEADDGDRRRSSALVREGVKKFAPDAALYVKPMYWARGRRPLDHLAPIRNSTRFCLSPVRGADAGAGRLFGHEVELSPPDARIDADRFEGGLPLSRTTPACCARPRQRGFDNALVCDALGNVAETATSNVFMAKDGVVYTPAPNGTFLNGITRQRVIELLRDDGVRWSRATLRYEDFAAADEIFISGNYAKVMPVLRIDDRDLQPGPFYRKARELYWAFAHAKPSTQPPEIFVQRSCDGCYRRDFDSSVL